MRIVEHREGPRADGDRSESTTVIPPEQAADTPVEPESLEQENVGGDQRVHDSAPGRSSNFSDISRHLGTFHPRLIAACSGNALHYPLFDPKEWSTRMKSWLWQGDAAAAITLPSLSSVGLGGRNRRFRVLERDAQGRIRFRRYFLHPCSSSFAASNDGGCKWDQGVRRQSGKLTQRDYQGDNLAGPDFAPPGQENGTYQVNSDCTGSMVINLNVPTCPQASPLES